MKSDQINELASALAKAQGAMRAAVKDSTVRVLMKSGGSYTAKFATLASVFDAIREPFAANGLSITQLPSVQIEVEDREGGKRIYASHVVVETMMLHSSGQWISSDLRMPIDKDGPHAVASSISFARRYALGAICGIATDDDDDGNGAQGSTASAAFSGREDAKTKSKGVMKITKGPATGVAFPDATEEQLTAFGNYVRRVLDDPTKMQHRDECIRILNAIEAEITGRP